MNKLYNHFNNNKKKSHLKIIAQVFEDRGCLLLTCLSTLLTWLSHFICSDFGNAWILIKRSSQYNFIRTLSERRQHIHCVGTRKWAAHNPSRRDQDKPRWIFIFTLLLTICALQHFPKQFQMAQEARERRAAFRNTHQPLTIPLLPFYFVSHLDHLLI